MHSHLSLVACLILAGTSLAPALDHPLSFFDRSSIRTGSAHSINLKPPPSNAALYGHLGDDHHELAQVHELSRVIQRRQSVNADDKIQTLGFLGSTYNLPLTISSDPSQQIFVQLDTGSSDFWAISSSCDSPQCQSNDVLKFDESRSSSFRPLTIQVNPDQQSVNASSTSSSNITGSHQAIYDLRQFTGDCAQVPFNITYDDASSASGYLATENFTLSDLGVSNQVFALVNSTNLTLTSQGISGVLGLGFPRGSVISRSLINYQDQLDVATEAPLVFSILQQSQLSYPLFGLFLARDTGRITLGAIDPQILPTPDDRSQIQWHDVVPFPSGNTGMPANSTANLDGPALDSYVSWTLQLTGAGAADQAANLTPTYSAVGSSPLALLDSGSSSIVGPPAGVEAIFRHIRNSRHVGGGRFVVPCDTQERMYFSFGGRNITLLPQDYIIGPAAGQPFLCFAWPAAVDPSTDGTDWVLGTPFLRAVYSIYSIGINGKEAPKIGLYPLRQPADTTDSAVIFAPVPTESLSSFLQNQATLIASVLPNSLVPLASPTSRPYVFSNATSTASIGAAPTNAGAPETYQPILTASSGDESVPAVASSSMPIPVPSNPARDAAASTLRACSSLLVGLPAALLLLLSLS